MVYSALLTQALRVGAGGLVAVGRLAGLTLLLLGVMEMLVVEDARRVLNGATRRCLGGIPLYTYPLLVLFALAVVVRGGPAAYTVYAAAVSAALLSSAVVLAPWLPLGLAQES
ncbi:hypothetical protein [Pyrodictium abyssi]|uniref:Uncharacterized protein n=1 Tax=Pyrodictium abyssi TaxID=54256 RepID=A0ABM8ISB9_9CREN|nr:hypothetical protein PABY_00370 [Pyrodictium abyssi]